MADLHTKTKTLMDERRFLVMNGALRGARTATEEVAVGARPVPEPEVAATAKWRQFSSKEKRRILETRRILAAADRCGKAGAIGALLRREGIHSSTAAWINPPRQETATSTTHDPSTLNKCIPVSPSHWHAPRAQWQKRDSPAWKNETHPHGNHSSNPRGLVSFSHR